MNDQEQLESNVETIQKRILDHDSIVANDFLIIQNTDDRSSYICKVNGDQKLGKTRVSLKETIGEPYTTYYELTGRKFQKVSEYLDSGADHNEILEEQRQQGEENQLFNSFSDHDIQNYVTSILDKNLQVEGVRGDNSGYVDTNTAQRLRDTDILNLREKGLNGEEIIKHLIENSQTFGIKSDFAQAKWIKRKEKKYRKKYQLIKCTPASICEASYLKNKDKISNMRYDTLAQIISQSGVHAGTRILVVESLVGMLIGALAYRMRGYGKILGVYGSQQPHFDMVRNYNLSKEHLDIIESIPAVELGPAVKDVCANGFEDIQEFSLESEETQSVRQHRLERYNQLEASNEMNSKLEKKKKRLLDPVDQVSNTGRGPKALARTRSYLRQGVDRLIIASKYRPLPILKQALFLLAPSSPFVVFHEFLEPLVDCYLYLQEKNLALRMVLCDTWLREFQTLPGRTRPSMFMPTSGGFFLSGIYIGMVPCAYPFTPKTNTNTTSTSIEEPLLQEEINTMESTL